MKDALELLIELQRCVDGELTSQAQAALFAQLLEFIRARLSRHHRDITKQGLSFDDVVQQVALRLWGSRVRVASMHTRPSGVAFKYLETLIQREMTRACVVAQRYHQQHVHDEVELERAVVPAHELIGRIEELERLIRLTQEEILPHIGRRNSHHAATFERRLELTRNGLSIEALLLNEGFEGPPEQLAKACALFTQHGTRLRRSLLDWHQAMLTNSDRRQEFESISDEDLVFLRRFFEAL